MNKWADISDNSCFLLTKHVKEKKYRHIQTPNRTKLEELHRCSHLINASEDSPKHDFVQLQAISLLNFGELGSTLKKNVDF